MAWQLIRARQAVVPGLVAVAVILCTWVEGRWSDNVAALPSGFAKAVQAIPLETEAWEGRLLPPVDPRVLQISGAAAIVSAEYRHRTTGDRVTVFLVGGWSRDVAVHTPDACYPGAGFTMEDRPYPFALEYAAAVGPSAVRGKDGDAGEVRSAEFTTAVFTKAQPTGTVRLRVFWAWRGKSGWESPAMPRWTYGGHRPLVKVYFVSESPVGGLPHHSPATDLARQLLPRLDAVLSPALESQKAGKP